MSMLMLNRSSLTIVTISEERERRGTARVEVFSGGGTLGTVRSGKKAISIVPRTSTSPHMDIIPSNSADRAGQISPITFPTNTAFLSPLAVLPLPQCSSSAIWQSFLDLDHLDSFPPFSGTSALVIPAPLSRFLKDAGMHAQKKVAL